MLLVDLASGYFLAETFTKEISQLLIHLWPKDNYVIIIQRTLLYIILTICLLLIVFLLVPHDGVDSRVYTGSS